MTSLSTIAKQEYSSLTLAPENNTSKEDLLEVLRALEPILSPIIQSNQIDNRDAFDHDIHTAAENSKSFGKLSDDLREKVNNVLKGMTDRMANANQEVEGDVIDVRDIVRKPFKTLCDENPEYKNAYLFILRDTIAPFLNDKMDGRGSFGHIQKDDFIRELMVAVGKNEKYQKGDFKFEQALIKTLGDIIDKLDLAEEIIETRKVESQVFKAKVKTPKVPEVTTAPSLDDLPPLEPIELPQTPKVNSDTLDDFDPEKKEPEASQASKEKITNPSEVGDKWNVKIRSISDRCSLSDPFIDNLSPEEMEETGEKILRVLKQIDTKKLEEQKKRISFYPGLKDKSYGDGQLYNVCNIESKTEEQILKEIEENVLGEGDESSESHEELSEKELLAEIREKGAFMLFTSLQSGFQPYDQNRIINTSIDTSLAKKSLERSINAKSNSIELEEKARETVLKKGINECSAIAPIKKDIKEKVVKRGGLFKRKKEIEEKVGERQALCSEYIKGGSNEPAYHFSYQTVNKDHIEITGRTGNIIIMNYILPESTARKVNAMIKKNPNFVRMIIENAMVEEFGKRKWKGLIRPPYEDWREGQGVPSKLFFQEIEDEEGHEFVLKDEVSESANTAPDIPTTSVEAPKTREEVYAEYEKRIKGIGCFFGDSGETTCKEIRENGEKIIKVLRRFTEEERIKMGKINFYLGHRDWISRWITDSESEKNWAVGGVENKTADEIEQEIRGNVLGEVSESADTLVDAPAETHTNHEKSDNSNEEKSLNNQIANALGITKENLTPEEGKTSVDYFNLAKKSNWQEAGKNYFLCVILDPENKDGNNGEAYLEIGRILKDKKLYKEAEKTLKLALVLGGNCNALMAEVLVKTGKFKEAVENYKKANLDSNQENYLSILEEAIKKSESPNAKEEAKKELSKLKDFVTKILGMRISNSSTGNDLTEELESIENAFNTATTESGQLKNAIIRIHNIDPIHFVKLASIYDTYLCNNKTIKRDPEIEKEIEEKIKLIGLESYLIEPGTKAKGMNLKEVKILGGVKNGDHPKGTVEKIYQRGLMRNGRVERKLEIMLSE